MADLISIGKYRSLARKLWIKTSQDEISWSRSLLASGFDIDVGNVTVNLSEVERHAVTDYKITLYTDKMVEADSFTDETISDDEVDDVDGFSGYFTLMQALYARVKRQVEGADIVLDQVLHELDKGSW